MPKVCVPHRARCAREGGAPHSLWPHWAGLSRHHTCPRDVFINQAPRSWVGAASHRGSPRSCLIHHPRSVPSQCRVHRITRVPGGSLGQQAAPPACWSPVPGARGGAAGVLRLVLGGGVPKAPRARRGISNTALRLRFEPLPAESPLHSLARLRAQGWGLDPTGTRGPTPAGVARWQNPHRLSVTKSSGQETEAPGEGCRAGIGSWGTGGPRRGEGGVQAGFLKRPLPLRGGLWEIPESAPQLGSG